MFRSYLREEEGKKGKKERISKTRGSNKRIKNRIIRNNYLKLYEFFLYPYVINREMVSLYFSKREEGEGKRDQRVWKESHSEISSLNIP